MALPLPASLSPPSLLLLPPALLRLALPRPVLSLPPSTVGRGRGCPAGALRAGMSTTGARAFSTRRSTKAGSAAAAPAKNAIGARSVHFLIPQPPFATGRETRAIARPVPPSSWRMPGRSPPHDVSTAKICVRCCWDGPPGAFLMVSAGSPHLPGWLGHWGYAPLALQVPLAELPTTAPDIGPPDGGWWARARGARRHPPGPARRLLAPRPAPFRLVWPGGRMRAASAGCR